MRWKKRKIKANLWVTSFSELRIKLKGNQMNFHDLLQKMVQHEASDMFVTAKLAVSAKINGELVAIDEKTKNVTLLFQLTVSGDFVFRHFGSVIWRGWLFVVL